MKNIFKYLACSIALFGAGMFSGCNNDIYITDGINSGDSPRISIDTPEVSITRADAIVEINLNADSNWSVECDQTWAAAIPSSGEGSQTVQIQISKNESGTIRRAQMTFIVYQKATGWKWGKAELTITQSATDEIYIQGDVEKLVEFIKTKHAGVSSSNGTATLEYDSDSIEAVVLANYGDGNIGTILAVGDNNGLPNSAILLYDSAFGTSSPSNYPVGSVVTVSGLKNATYNNYYGLRELKGVTAKTTGQSKTLVVPELTVDQVLTNDYQGQYVTVKDVQATEDWNGKAWIAESQQSVTVKDASGSQLTLRMGKSSYAPKFLEYTINSSVVGNVRVLCEYYSSNVQVMPVYVNDVLEISNVDLLVSQNEVILDVEEGSTAVINVRAAADWTSSIEGAGFTISPNSGDGANNEVTITATTTSTDALSKSLGSITFAAVGKTAKVVVRQKGVGGTNSIEGLNDYIKVNGGANLGEYGSITAIVAANNESGNYFGKLVATDNTGNPNSGMIFYDTATTYNESNYPVGSEIEIDLSEATYSPYSGLPEIKGAKFALTGNKVELKVPELTVEEANNEAYLCQYICVKNVAPAAEGYWNDTTTNYVNTNLTDTANKTVTVRVSKDAVFAKSKYIVERGNVYGVMEVYNSSFQLFPVSAADVAAFNEPTEPLFNIDVTNLSFVANGQSHDIDLKIKNIANYDVVTSVTNDQFVCTVSEDKTKVTVTAGVNPNDSAIDAVLTIKVVFEGGELSQEVALKQNANVSSDAAQTVITLAGIESAVGGEIAKAYIGNVEDPASWLRWKTDGVEFAGVRIQAPTASSKFQGTIQFQGASSDVTKQGFIANTESLGDIQQIIVVLQSAGDSALDVNIYMGSKTADDAAYVGEKVVPTDREVVAFENGYRHIITYSFAGNNYEYFKLINETRSAAYAESITVFYKK